MNNAKEKMKKRTDAKHNDFTSDFTVGSLVLVLNSRKLSRKGGKMEPLWHGPYRIHEDLGKDCFKLSLVQQDPSPEVQCAMTEALQSPEQVRE